MDPVSSTSSCSSRKITAQCPFRAQLAKRLYTLFQGPKRSGRSRQGMPAFTRNRTASMNSRSPLVAFGPVRWRGRKAPSRAHCASVNACRCTQIFDHIGDPRTSSKWLIFLSDRNDPSFRSPRIRDTPWRAGERTGRAAPSRSSGDRALTEMRCSRTRPDRRPSRSRPVGIAQRSSPSSTFQRRSRPRAFRR